MNNEDQRNLNSAIIAAKKYVVNRFRNVPVVIPFAAEIGANIASLGYLVGPLKRLFSNEQLNEIFKAKEFLAEILYKLSQISKSLYKFNFCLNVKNIVLTCKKITELVEINFRNTAAHVLYNTFVFKLLQLVTDLNFHFSIFLSDFAQINYFLTIKDEKELAEFNCNVGRGAAGPMARRTFKSAEDRLQTSVTGRTGSHKSPTKTMKSFLETKPSMKESIKEKGYSSWPSPKEESIKEQKRSWWPMGK